MYDINWLQSLSAAFIAAFLSLIVQLLLVARKELSDLKMAIGKRRSDNHLRRYDQLTKLIAVMSEALRICSDFQYQTMLSGSQGEKYIAPEADYEKKQIQRIASMCDEAVVIAEIYGEIPSAVHIDNFYLSTYLSTVLSRKLKYSLRIDNHWQEQRDAYRHCSALLNDIRLLMAFELASAEQGMKEEKLRKIQSLELPYIQHLRPYFPKPDINVNSLDTTFLES